MFIAFGPTAASDDMFNAIYLEKATLYAERDTDLGAFAELG